ncbi:hypothetical protein N3K66_008433 [Trichothecium roseum]|uniref:Uncharacterized protein n=1 Tax=Trichothecium roseum TaxID=47278 RepID=A0ACC0UQ77_9HYPO|nr:hypothetical protein N3K66_008433 [Trichothecium roseum]
MEPINTPKDSHMDSPTVPGRTAEQQSYQNLHYGDQQPNPVTGSISRHDENLPEVYMDDSPRSMPVDLKYGSMDSTGNPPKYPVVMEDTMKSSVAEVDGSPKSTPDQASKEVHSGGAALPNSGPGRRTIFGLTRRLFFILLAIGLIIIAAAVGGGVGGGLAAASSKDSKDQAVDDSDSSAGSSTTSSIASSTTTTSSSPEETGTRFLNNETAPEDNRFSFQSFSQNEYGGQASNILDQTGGTDFDFLVRSYVWLPESSGCCVSFCLNDTTEGLVGWWCDERYQKKTSETYTRSYIWCGLERSKKNARCS